jgi:hypothetical protein
VIFAFFMTECNFMILTLIKVSGVMKNSKFKPCTPLQVAGDLITGFRDLRVSAYM